MENFIISLYLIFGIFWLTFCYILFDKFDNITKYVLGIMAFISTMYGVYFYF